MSSRVRVATWNCFGVPSGLLGVVLGKPHHPARFRVEAIARAFGAYDVVCVQESFLDDVATFFHDVADRLGRHLWHDRQLPHVLARSRFGGGLVIIDTSPLEVSFETFAERGCGFDAWAIKGFAVCSPRTHEGERYRLVNLHLQSDDPILAPHVYKPARMAQLEALLAALERPDLPGAGLPTIICGDLNVPEGSDEYHQLLVPRMRAFGFHDVAAGYGLHTYSRTKNAIVARLDERATDVRVDYIFGDARVRAISEPHLLLADSIGHVDEPPVFASDHFGIGIELELA